MMYGGDGWMWGGWGWGGCDEGAWTGRMGRRLRETGLQEHPLMAAAAA